MQHTMLSGYDVEMTKIKVETFIVQYCVVSKW